MTQKEFQGIYSLDPNPSSLETIDSEIFSVELNRFENMPIEELKAEVSIAYSILSAARHAWTTRVVSEQQNSHLEFIAKGKEELSLKQELWNQRRIAKEENNVSALPTIRKRIRERGKTTKDLCLELKAIMKGNK